MADSEPQPAAAPPDSVEYSKRTRGAAVRALLHHMESAHLGTGLYRDRRDVRADVPAPVARFLYLAFRAQCQFEEEKHQRDLADAKQKAAEARARQQAEAAPELAEFLAAGPHWLGHATEPRELAFEVNSLGMLRVRVDGVVHQCTDEGAYAPRLPELPGAAPTAPMSLRELASLALARALPDMDTKSRRVVAQTLFPNAKAPPSRRARDEGAAA